jgi:hypothetical protein
MSFKILKSNYQSPKTARRCSFCKEPGHNIKNCTDNRLLDFEYDCSVHVQNAMSMLDFTFWINEAYSANKELLKSYAVNKGLIKNKHKHSFFECCKKISSYLCEIYKPEFSVEENEEESLESMMLNLVERFGTQSERFTMPQFEIQDNVGIERILMREMLAYMLVRDMFNPGEENNAVVKRKINLTSKNIIYIDTNELCECGICLNDKMEKDIIELQCVHQVCKECVIQIIQTKKDGNPTCPYCRAEIIGLKCKTNDVKNELTPFVG